MHENISNQILFLKLYYISYIVINFQFINIKSNFCQPDPPQNNRFSSSWSWTGGHADGDTDMLYVAEKEAKEETGIRHLRVLKTEPGKYSLAAVDVLPVWGHVKRGKYVSAHLHLNLSYLFEADEAEALHIKEDENSQVGWIPVARLREKVTEPDMIPVYEKLISLGKNIKRNHTDQQYKTAMQNSCKIQENTGNSTKSVLLR